MTHHTVYSKLTRAGRAGAAALALFLSLASALPARAQAPADDFARGQQLLALGDAKGARKVFERAVKLRPDSAEAHAGLAVALLKLDKMPDAAREAERALALDQKAALAHYVIGAALLRVYVAESERVNDQYPMHSKATEETRKPVFEKREAALAPLKGRMRATAERLEALAGSLPGNALPGEALELADTLRVYGNSTDTYRQAEVTTRAVINHKPEPAYTMESRGSKTSGVVRLRAVLAADGRVKNILVIKGLPDGLTEKAVEAAQRIDFTPAIKGGRPVSQFVILEYHFSAY